MMNMLVYVDRVTCDTINLWEREEIIYDRACALIEDQDLFEEFLAKKYKRVELLYMTYYSALEIHKEFFEECRLTAEKEFEENYVEKTIMIKE